MAYPTHFLRSESYELAQVVPSARLEWQRKSHDRDRCHCVTSVTRDIRISVLQLVVLFRCRRTVYFVKAKFSIAVRIKTSAILATIQHKHDYQRNWPVEVIDPALGQCSVADTSRLILTSPDKIICKTDLLGAHTTDFVEGCVIWARCRCLSKHKLLPFRYDRLVSMTS